MAKDERLNILVRRAPIQDTVAEKVQRLRWLRLAQECAKLQLSAEQAAAEEWFCSEAEWLKA